MVGRNLALSESIGWIGWRMIGLPPMVAASKQAARGCEGQERGDRKVVIQTSWRGGMRKMSTDGKVRQEARRGGRRWYIEKRRMSILGRL